MTDADPRPADPATTPSSASGGDRALLAFFWLWAAVLLVATLAQLFKWQGVLDVLDVKGWFAR